MTNLKIKSTCTLLAVLICASSIVGQSKRKEKKSKESKSSFLSAGDQATKEFDNMAYSISIEKYLSKKELNTEDKVRIANAYRLNSDAENAAIWYAEVIEESDDAIHKLHYAQALQSTGHTEEAAEYYQQYKDSNPADATWSSTSKVFAEMTDDQRFPMHDVELKNEENINTEHLEYSPTMFKKSVIYVSTQRPENYSHIKKDPWLDDYFMTLYEAKVDKDKALSDPSPFSTDLISKFHEGPVSFTKDGKTLYFTRNNIKGKRRINDDEGVLRLKIYSTTKENDGWSKAQPLPFCTDDLQEAHPSISPDGKTLYFASNREGGQGGMDLYKSVRKGSTWSEPENLGPEINTPANEVFPFIHENGKLYFASNGLDGLGGLDIFHAEEAGESFVNPQNIGQPFNSEKDDFGFVIDAENKRGYLTSARDGGSGKDDIYSFNANFNTLNTYVLNICAMDAESETEISNASVVLQDLAGIEGDAITYYTDADGETKIEVDPKKEYSVLVSAKGYESGERTITAEELKSRKTICVPLMTRRCGAIAGIVKSIEGQILSSANLLLTNKSTGETMSAISNGEGTYSFDCVECEAMYTIKASKNPYTSTIEDINDMSISCSETRNLDLFLGNGNEAVTVNQNTDFSANTAPVLGDRFVLEEILYDFNDARITTEASYELDKVVSFMQRYPNVSVELGSHTDVRGTDNYNARLSDRRARSATQYIVNQGISSYRISARGYGESTLRNDCYDGVDCTEEEHHYNRRTEIKITDIDGGTVIESTQSTKIHDHGDERHNSGWDNSSDSVESFVDEDTNTYFDDTNVTYSGIYHVVAGSYDSYRNAEKKLRRLKRLGYDDAIINDTNELGKYQVHAKSGLDESSADLLVNRLREKGIDSFAKSENAN